MIQETLREALHKHQQGDLAGASSLYLRILQADPNNVDALGLMSIIADGSGDHETAIDLANKAINLKPNRVEFYINLANPLIRSERWDEAIETLEKALKVDRRSIDVFSTMGDAYQGKGEFQKAIECYHKGLRLDRSDPILYNNLGNALRCIEDYDEALSCYEKALSLDPNYVDAHFNRGTTYKIQGHQDQAKEIFLRIAQDYPRHHKTYRELAKLSLIDYRPLEAIDYYKLAIQHNPNPRDTYDDLLAMGEVYLQCQKHDLAEDCLQVALRRNPDELRALVGLVQVYSEQCRVTEEAELYEKLIAIDPDNLAFHVSRALTMPPLYESVEAVNTRREQAEREIQKIVACSEQYKLSELLKTSFYLSYQGKNDRPMMEQLAKLYTPHMKIQPYTAPKVQYSKIRVGFVSANLSPSHTIGKLYYGLIQNLCREQFHVTVFSVNSPNRYQPTGEEHPEDQFITLPLGNFAQAKELILAQDLDILFYPDIGMEAYTYSLAFHRLAKIQCVSWGHPVTTGLKTIDYFVSSELIEAENAQEHYTETLYKFKNMPVFYSRPPEAPRADVRDVLGLSEDDTFYTCPQSIFKMHPEFDEMIAGILRKDPKGRLVLLRSPVENPNKVLMERFKKVMPDVVDRIILAPRLFRQEFLMLLATADVMLDPLHFGGGNTTYEALSYGTPIVTLPSEFMRGRVTLGCYRQMDYTELVAKDKQDYIDLAVRIGTNPEERARVRAEILSRCDVLYENHEAVRELESFFLKAMEADCEKTKQGAYYD